MGCDVASRSPMDLIRQKLGDRRDDFLLPPPVYLAMGAEVVAYDAARGVLSVRFPLRDEYINAYGTVQGGVVAAAVDNVLGPLSMLVAPPNYTRRLEMTYSRPVTPDLEYIVVKGTFLGREGRWLSLRAEMRAPDGTLLARARAKHWVIEDDDEEQHAPLRIQAL